MSLQEQFIYQITDHSYSQTTLNPTVVEELLGVTISNTLCWDAHIEQLIKQCNSYLFLLSRIKMFFMEDRCISNKHSR